MPHVCAYANFLRVDYILAILCIAIYFCDLQGQNLGKAQQNLKKDIFNFLQKEVTNLTNYSATDLRFTYNNTTYFVSISESDINPMYATLSASFDVSEYNKEIKEIVGRKFNEYKGVKTYVGDDYIKFQAEMFLNDSNPFVTSFKHLIEIMEAMRNSFGEEFDKVKSQKPSSFSSFVSSYTKQSNEYIWPYSSTSNDNKLFVSKVTLNKNNSILDFVSYNGGLYQWCSIDRNSYLLINGKRYSLTKAEGIAYNPQHTDYPNYQSGENVSLKFRLYFPPIPKGTTSFDFYESTAGGWSIKTIMLENGNTIKVSGTPIETSVHK